MWYIQVEFQENQKIIIEVTIELCKNTSKILFQEIDINILID